MTTIEDSCNSILNFTIIKFIKKIIAYAPSSVIAPNVEDQFVGNPNGLDFMKGNLCCLREDTKMVRGDYDSLK